MSPTSWLDWIHLHSYNPADFLFDMLLVWLFFQVVREAVGAGVDGYDAFIKQSVKKAAYRLRLSREVAMSIAGKVVSIHFQLALSQVYFLSLYFSCGGGGRVLALCNLFTRFFSVIKFNQVIVGKLGR